MLQTQETSHGMDYPDVFFHQQVLSTTSNPTPTDLTCVSSPYRCGSGGDHFRAEAKHWSDDCRDDPSQCRCVPIDCSDYGLHSNYVSEKLAHSFGDAYTLLEKSSHRPAQQSSKT